MNEISRCCQVLGVKPGASVADVKKAYRDLVQIWHPDRFSENERLQAKTQEQLKEINLAYEHLMANGFQDGVLIEPAEGTGEREGNEENSTAAGERAEPQRQNESRKLVLAVLFVALMSCGAAIYMRLHAHSQSLNDKTGVQAPAGKQKDSAVEPVASDAAKPALVPTARLYPFSNDVRAEMAPTNGPAWLRATHLISPPFAIRANVTLTGYPDIRLHYGFGQVIFNWTDHPKDLRALSPRNADAMSVADKGILVPGQPVELIWKVETDGMSVSVNGEWIYHDRRNYEGIKAYPGIGPVRSKVALESFVIETPHPLENSFPVARDHGHVAGDALADMVAETNVMVTTNIEGLVLSSTAKTANRFMTAEPLRPPFTIRTRAKTDCGNLRLHYGKGKVTLDPDPDPRELRINDPEDGKASNVPGKGLVSLNEWHVIVWEVENTGMRVMVDGELRHQNHRDHQNSNAKAGIGPFNSTVTVDYFVIEKR